jgi:hypothetical protein
MWIILEPKTVALWNKRHFEKKNLRVCSMFKILSTYSCWKKYIKCNIWRVAVRPSYIWDARFLKVNRTTLQVFVTYLTGALYVHPLWFYKHQHDNRVRSTQNAFSLPLAAILVSCAPSGEMHNYCKPHVIKDRFENFLIHRCNYLLLSQVYCVWQVVKIPTTILNNPVFRRLRGLEILDTTERCSSQGGVSDSIPG